MVPDISPYVIPEFFRLVFDNNEDSGRSRTCNLYLMAVAEPMLPSLSGYSLVYERIPLCLKENAEKIQAQSYYILEFMMRFIIFSYCPSWTLVS